MSEQQMKKEHNDKIDRLLDKFDRILDRAYPDTEAAPDFNQYIAFRWERIREAGQLTPVIHPHK